MFKNDLAFYSNFAAVINASIYAWTHLGSRQNSNGIIDVKIRFLHKNMSDINFNYFWIMQQD